VFDQILLLALVIQYWRQKGAPKPLEMLALLKLAQHPKVHERYITNHENTQVLGGFISLK